MSTSKKYFMDTNFIERIKVIVEKGGGQNAFARQCGLSLGAIQRYLKGGDPTRRALIAMARAAGVSLNWLALGVEEKQAPVSPHSIPVMGFAECGLRGWYSEVDWRGERPEFVPTDPDAFAVIATGQSMVPVGIKPGHVCIVSPNADVERGDPVFIRRKDGTATIKTYVGHDENWVRIRGYLNPDETGAQEPYIEDQRQSNIVTMAPIHMIMTKPF